MNLPLALRALLLVLLALVPAAVVQAILENEGRNERHGQISEEAMRTAQLVAGQQERTFEGARHILAAMGAHDAIRLGVPSEACDAFLARLVTTYPRYITANSFSLSGDLVCGAHQMPIWVNVADRPYFQDILAGADFAVGRYTIGRGTGQRSLHLAAPLRAADGSLQGALVVALSIDWLNADLQAASLPAGSAASISDADGVVLARRPGGDAFIGTLLPPMQRELTHRPTAGVFDAPALDGVRRIAGYVPISQPPLGVMVAVGLDVEPLLGQEVARERSATIMILGSLLLALVVAIVAFHLGVERPVARLLAAAQAWSRQEWSARIGPIGSSSEFRRIGAALDEMADAVRRSELARQAAASRVQALSEVSPQVVFTTDAKGRVDWVNGYWRQLTGRSVPRSQGTGWLQALHREDRQRAITAWRAALADVQTGGQGEFSMDFRICRVEDNTWRWFLCRAAPIRDAEDRITSWAGVALDVDDLRRTQAFAEEQMQRLETTYRNAPAGLCLLDRQLRFVAVNKLLADSIGQPPEAHLGRSLREMAPVVADQIEAALRDMLKDGEPEQFELQAPSAPAGGGLRTWLCSFIPLRDTRGAIAGVSGSVLDITDRKRAEERERLLSREVDHRAKNVLAVVRSLVRISVAESPDDMEGMVEALEGRISAMARVHTLLSDHGWMSAELTEIATAETAAHHSQISLDGSPVWLVPEAAQPITLVLHELVTNATKHGALSRSGGSVTLRWVPAAHEGHGRGLRLDWIENGGPELAGAPEKTGFGTILIDSNAGDPLDGRIERIWAPGGLHCTLHIGPGALLQGEAP